MVIEGKMISSNIRRMANKQNRTLILLLTFVFVLIFLKLEYSRETMRKELKEVNEVRILNNIL